MHRCSDVYFRPMIILFHFVFSAASHLDNTYSTVQLTADKDHSYWNIISKKSRHTLVMRKHIVVVENVLCRLNSHQFATLNVNCQFDLGLAAQRHRFCLQHSIFTAQTQCNYDVQGLAITYFVSSHYYWRKAIRSARQGKARAWARAVDLSARSFDLACPGVTPPLLAGLV